MKKKALGCFLLCATVLGLFGLFLTACGGGGGTQTPPPVVQAANFSASPASLSFGDVLVSPSTTSTVSVTITNSGNANLVISSTPTIGGTNAADFKLVKPPAAPITLAPNSSTTLQVSFTPSATVSESASLSFSDNAAGSPHTVSLGGRGILPPAQAADAAVMLTAKGVITTFPATVTVTINGTDTTFYPGATMANFGPGATVSSGKASANSANSQTNSGSAGQFGLVNVLDATTATAQVTFDATAGPGPRSVIVATGSHQSVATFVIPAHAVPLANAGMPQIIAVGKTAHLDGAASSTSNPPLTYQWTMLSAPSGSTAAIANATSVQPSVVVDQAGTYLVELDVTDGNNNTAKNWTMVSTTLTPPVANAGRDQFVSTGATVQLDGSASSDFAGNSLTYLWAFVSVPAGSTAALSNPTAVAPSFVADVAGDYLLQLTVNDGQGNTSSDTTLVSTKEVPPVANAGPNQLVNVGSQAQLNGSASSDPDGNPITCSWTLLTQPTGGVPAQLNNAGPSCTTKPTFTAGEAGIYVAELTVTDSQNNSSTANVTVVTPPNDPGPVAVAGSYQAVPKGTTVQLDGSQSSAAGNPLAYSWAMLSKPTGSAAALTTGSDPSKQSFVADLGGDYVSQLIVSDGMLFSPPSTVRVTATVPGFSASANLITFPAQHLNTTSNSMPVVISNTGNGTLHILSITKSGANPGDFAFTSAAPPIPVAPGATTTINVTFTPTAAGARSAALNITNDATTSPATVALTGTGGIPAVQFTPNPLNFGPQLVNTPAQQTLKISNTGDGILTVTALAVSGTNPGDFVVLPTSIPPISPGGFQNLTVTFTPSLTGTRTATLTLTDNTLATSDAISFSGVGTQPGIGATPNPLAFGNQLVKTASAAQSTTVTNTGTANLVITGLTLSGANAADFAFPSGFTLPTPTSPITVAPQGTTSLSLIYTPHAMGASTATLSITYQGGANAYTVSLNGTGVAPVVSISPNPVAFANQLVNTSSAPLPVTISNANGTAALTITAMTFSGTNAADFAFPSNFTPPTPGSPLTVPAGGTATVNLIFKPTTNAAESATLTLTDNALDSPQSVPLTGNGVTPVIGFNPSTVAFGNQTVNIASSPKQLTINNTGSSLLTISAISKAGANPGDFTFSPAAPISIDPGKSTVLNVTFTPTVVPASAESASLVFTDNTIAGTDTIQLTGTGVVPGINLSANNLNFGSQALKVASAPSTVTVTNNGQGVLQITGLTFTGANLADFSFPAGFTSPTPANPITVQPNANVALNVIFTPQNEAAESATLNITSNATPSTTTVALSGTGVAAHIALTPALTLAFGNQQQGTASNPATITITNSGGADLSITALVVSGNNAADFTFSPAPTFPITVPKSNGSATLSMIFKASTAGAESATLSFTDNAASGPNTLSLTGTGTAPQMGTLSPLTFPNTNLGVTSSPLTLTVTNTGTAPLQITGLSFGGNNPGDFGFAAGFTPPTQAAPITLAANGGTTGIPVVFSPAVAGTRTASLAIADNAAGSPHSVGVSGIGLAPGINLSTTSLNFNNQAVGQTSAALPVVIINNGTSNLHISTLSITGNNASDFAELPAAPLDVAPNASLTLNVTFTPSASGTRSATLSIADNVPGSPQTVTLTGTGVAPVIGINPNPAAFGNQTVNIPSAAKQITISNTGNTTLTISAITKSGTNAADFSFSPAAPISVAPGNNTVLNVTFTPSLAAAESATFVLTDNTVAGTDSISLSGTGVQPGISLSSANLNFGSQAVKVASSPLTVTVTNTGQGTLLISSLTFSGLNSGDFSFPAGFTPPTQANPITVQPNANAVLSVIFTPQLEAGESATLNIASNASPQSVGLSGTGVAAHIALSPNGTLPFGNQQVGTTSSPATITLTNSGGADLIITALPITGNNAGDFSFSPAPTLPITVPKNNGSATLSMIFKPGTAGAESATLTFTDNAASGPNTLSLTGTGTAPVMGPLSALSFPSTNTGTTSSPQALTVTNVGTAPIQITGLSFGGNNPGDFGFASGFTPPTQASPIIINPNLTASIPVTFTPTAGGTRSATLLIADNAAGAPHSAQLSGTGVAVPGFSVSPTSLTFPSTPVGTPSAPLSLTMTNTGQADLTISNFFKLGSNPNDYSVTIAGGASFPQTIHPNLTLVVNVVFTPAATGPSSATIVFSDNTSQGSHSVAVSGTGVQAQALLSPNPLQFPQQAVQTTSPAMAVTVTNSGSADLSITAASLSGGQAADFAVTTTISASQPLIVPKNGGTGTINITFTPGASGARTATLTITDNASPSQQSVTLNGTGFAKGTFTLNSTSLGFNLEARGIGTVDVAPSSALTVTITSSDPSKVLVDPTATDPLGTSAGTASFQGTIAAGTNLTPGFWIQALASSGTAQVTISAPGYNPAVATVTLTPSGFQLNGPNGIGVNFPTTPGANSSLSTVLVQLDNSGNVLTTGASGQVLRGGVVASMTVNSGTPGTGTIGGNPATVQPANSGSSTVTFQAVAAGTSLLTITPPSGYLTPNTGAQLTVTVTAPTITLNPVSVGFNQQALGSGSLSAASSSPLVVTITSGSPNVLLSTSSTTVGSNQIGLPVAAGATSLPAFYIQALASSGTVQLTASATGYSFTATGNNGSVALTPSGFVLSRTGDICCGANFSTTTISSPTSLTVTFFQLSSSLQPVGNGAQLRPGISNLSVPVTSGTPNTGTIVGGSPVGSATFNGGDTTNTSLSFQPNQNCSGACTSVLSVTQPSGFSSPVLPKAWSSLTVTVNQPKLTLLMVDKTVGGNLEAPASGSLDAAAPSPLTVTITSSDSTKVLLSNCGQTSGCTSPATSAGSPSITLTIPQGGGVTTFPSFYVQARANSGTVQLTGTAPGYASSSITVTLVPAGFVIDGGNGPGANVSAAVNCNPQTNCPKLTITAVLLDPNTLAPSGISQVVSGALPPSSVTVTSNNPDAVVTNSPVPIPAGTASGTVNVQTGSTSGQTATITAVAPSAFSTPSAGNSLGVVIQ